MPSDLCHMCIHLPYRCFPNRLCVDFVQLKLAALLPLDETKYVQLRGIYFCQEPENEASRKKRWEGVSRKIPSKCNNGIMRSPQIDSQGTLENIWMGLSRGEQGELQVFWGEWGFILVFKVEFLR